MAKENFNAIFEALTNPNLSNEGTKWFPGDKNDPNPTQSGITQNAYNRYLKRNDLPITSVRGISDEQRSAITREDYWNKVGGDQLPSGLDYQALDIAFNAGVPRAAYLMKQALGLPLLGTSSSNEPWTNDIVSAAQGLQGNDLQNAISKFTDARHDLYGSFKQADTFPGWFTRADNVGNAALRLAQQGPIAITGDVPLPPGRPNDGSNGITPRPSEVIQGLNNFSDSITQGLADGFTALTGRIPTAQEFQGRLNDVASGTRSLFDQLTDIAGSAEAKTFSQATGIDPSQYVLNDIYRLGLNRDVDPGSAASQMEVLRNQGGQSLYNQLTNSQEGRSLALGNFYENNFHRDIDQGGLSKYLSDLAAGKSMQAVQTDILSSPEAQSLGITPDQFASLIQPSYLSPSIGPSGLTSPVGPGSTTYPIGADGFQVGAVPGTETSPVGPGATTYPIGPGALTPPVGPGATTSPVTPSGYDVNAVVPPETGTINGGTEVSPISPTETSAVPPPGLTAAVQPDLTPTVPAPAAVPAFNADAYRAANPDVAAFGMDPLQHFLKFGYNEGRSIDAAGDKLPQGFNATAYLAANPDVASFGMNPLEHFARFGASEGRSLSPTGFSNANVSGGVGNGTFAGTFNPSQYLAANPDVANSGMNPLDHFLRFGAAEGRAVDTAGDRLPQNFDGNAYLAQNQDVARLGMNPLEHYLRFGAAEGRAAPTGSNPFSFSGINASQGLGPTGDGTFHGTFNGADYLAANRDVAASGMNPLDHYLQFGFNEGRAIDTRGDAITKGFDPLQYLNLNQDVKAAGMDPLRHYLTSGASEGRALPTGSNPYSFSNFNVAQGAGPTGNGVFGLGGFGSTAPVQMPAAPAPAPQAAGPINPFGFSSLNAGTYAAPSLGSVAGGGGGSIGWESVAPNALPGSGGGSGSAYTYTDNNGQQQIATFDPKKSENAYLAGQVAQNQAQIEAGRASEANNPNLWNYNATNLLNSVAASNYQPAPIYSTATAATYALPPAMPAPFNSPLPVMQQGLRVNPYGGFGLISAF